MGTYNLKKIEDYKVTHKDRVIDKLIHYNAKYKVLDTNFKAQNTLFNLLNKTCSFLHYSAYSTMVKLSRQKHKKHIELSLPNNSFGVSHKSSVLRNISISSLF